MFVYLPVSGYLQGNEEGGGDRAANAWGSISKRFNRVFQEQVFLKPNHT